jgi:hypothetical protein
LAWQIFYFVSVNPSPASKKSEARVRATNMIDLAYDVRSESLACTHAIKGTL